jgi:hypothetical protein
MTGGIVMADPAGALASSVASTLVGLMVTDAWNQAKTAIVDFWRRQRPQQAERVAEDLDDAQKMIRRARESKNRQAEAAVLAEWEGRLRTLIALHPTAADDLARVLKRLQPSFTARTSTVAVEGDVRDNARIYQDNNIVHGASRDVYQARGDMSLHYEYDDVRDFTKYIFSGKGPGRALAALGVAIGLVCAAGWMSIIFAVFNARGPNVQSLNFFGDVLPSGIPVGIVYFLGVGAGGVIAKVGSSMAKSGAQGRNTLGHLVIAVAIVIATIMCLDKMLDGAPLSTLTPHFAITGIEAPSKASR